MKFIVQFGLLCLISSVGFFQASSVSLDGTTGVSIYQAASYPFANTDFARGFVRLNGGFSVPAASTVNFNVLMPVAGPINLNSSGQITFEGDLALASNATLVTGGILDGQGFSFFLNGDFTIPAGQTLACSSNTVIDGQGHELILASGTPGGQILINGSGTTLTLRNMILRGLKEYGSGNRGIKFGVNPNQTLILENVEIHLAGHYVFTGGSLGIQGFTSLQGWNTFEYQASHNCTIQQDSTLFIDMHTGFSYKPSDLNDQHLVMTDSTSRLFLNGCTLSVPPSTGLFLTKGHLIVDHNTTFFGSGASQILEGIVFGDGVTSDDLNIDIMPAGNINLNSAFLTYANQN